MQCVGHKVVFVWVTMSCEFEQGTAIQFVERKLAEVQQCDPKVYGIY